MAQNLELKIQINSIEEIEQILLGLDIEKKGILRQRDIYYKSAKGLLKLRCENGTYCIIKYLRDETAKQRWSDYEILRLEGNNVERYLQELFEVEVIVEKSRQLYLYKNTRIHLDRVNKLGDFIELETVVNSTQENAIQEFNELVQLLKVNKSEQIKCSYRDLLIRQ
ncbi:MAG: hypothetical protein A2V66_18345 [Ignavibacteria bacterium RBG_13_36_8]|nr:MAG: hypothetical protein A2V66_18345 [Ignavibacteria bacterium RBG_13_36_8]